MYIYLMNNLHALSLLTVHRFYEYIIVGKINAINLVK